VDVKSTVEVIVNRHNPRSKEVSTADVSRMMHVPVRALLPCDEAAALSAANAGRPLAEGTPLQIAIAELASPGGPAVEPSRLKRSLARLFSTTPA
jgi:Flp pilus assembly CpaE family ATPase